MVSEFATKPKAPVAGKRFAASVTVRTNAGSAVASARVACSAKAGALRARFLFKSFRGSTATCTWRVPPKTQRKLLKGSVKVTSGVASVTRRFTKRIRPPTDV